MNTRPNKQLFTASLALVIIAASGLASAAPEKKQTRDKDILRGPDVTTTDHPTTQSDKMNSTDSMKEMGDKPIKRTDRPVIFRDYMNAIRQLKSSEALELSEYQRDQIKVITNAYRADMKLFQEEHHEKILVMQNEIINSKRKNSLGTVTDTLVTSNVKRSPRNERNIQARQNLRKFIDSAPANGKAISKINQVLSSEQQTILKQTITENHAKAAQRKERPDRAQRRKGDDSKGNRVQRRNINANRVKNNEKTHSDQPQNGKPLTSDD